MDDRPHVDTTGLSERDRREQQARRNLLDHGAAELEPRPWNAPPIPRSAAELTQYALARSSELDADTLLDALALLPAARAEVDAVEVALLFTARSEGLTWAQIADAMGFRSPQACQQYVQRLSARQEKL